MMKGTLTFAGLVIVAAAVVIGQNGDTSVQSQQALVDSYCLGCHSGDTFACRRLQQWYESNVDLAPRVAALATYLGHAKASDTYWYLTGTPELLALAVKRFEALGARGGGRQ
jgi:hypothetical protein